MHLGILPTLRFIDRVAQMPLAHRIAMDDVTSLDLRRVRAVVTSTGTVGLEALGFSVRHLGGGPYKDLTGSHCLSSPSNVEIRAAADRIAELAAARIIAGLRRSFEFVESVVFNA